eukprot:gene583-1130_t
MYRQEQYDDGRDGRQIEFALPEPIQDFVFDLYQSSRRSLQIEEVQQIYDTRFKELSDKYFNNSAWPDAQSIAGECNHDEVFLVLYREMTLRHVFTKLKPQLTDFISAWINFSKLFGHFLNQTGPCVEVALSVQWGHDIVQEFVYEFQAFSQHRSLTAAKTSEELSMMQANRDVWTLPAVLNILNGMIKLSKAADPEGERDINTKSALSILGYFCMIEKSRLECLLGDYTASLRVIAPIKLWDRNELFTLIPSCHANLFYHTGLSLMMSRRYGDAIETFSDIILHISRMLKPGTNTNRQGLHGQLQKMLEKVLALASVCIVLCPGYRVDDHVRELVDTKLDEKYRRLMVGDLSNLESTFEHFCPKFISPAVPDYTVTATGASPGQEAIRLQVSIYSTETQRQMALLRIRSYLRLYRSIDLEKLARFSDMTVSELTSQLLSYNHKTMQIQSTQLGGGDGSTCQRLSTSDVHFHIQDKVMFIDSGSSQTDRSRAAERVFISGIRKNVEIADDVRRVFSRFGL